MKRKTILVVGGILAAAGACWFIIRNTEPKPPYTLEQAIDKAVNAAAHPYYGMKVVFSKKILDGGKLRPGNDSVFSNVEFYQLGQQRPTYIYVWFYPKGYEANGPYPDYKPITYAGYWCYQSVGEYEMIR